MHNNDILILFLAIIIGVVLYNYFFSRKAIVKRNLKRIPEKKIIDCTNEEVARVSGKIKYVVEPLIAPLSGRKCVFYYVLVEERRSNGKSTTWHTLIEEEAGADVLITDGRNYAVIETGMVKSYLIQDKQYSSGYGHDATTKLEKYLKDHQQESTGLFGSNKTLKYKEGILEEGETIEVIGKVRWKRKHELKLEIPAERILLISRTDSGEPVYLSDDPNLTGTSSLINRQRR